MKTWAKGLAISLTVVAGGAQAQATNGSCNSYRQDMSFSSGTTIYYPGGNHLAGEVTRFAVTGDYTRLSISRRDTGAVLCDGAAACNGLSFTAPADGTYYFAVTGRGNPSGTVTASCTAATTGPDIDGGDGGDTGGDGASSSSAGGEGAATSGAAGAAGAAAGRAIASGIAGARSGAGSSATRSGLFFSTKGIGGTDNGMNFWSELRASNYGGALDGNGAQLSFGVETTLAGGTMLGLAGSYGRLDVSYGGTPVEVRSLDLGPYFSTAIAPGITLEGHLAFGRPEYRLAAGSYRANRLLGGLSLSANHMLGQMELDSFVSLSGFREKHPDVTLGLSVLSGKTVSSAKATIGTRITFQPQGPIRPYLSLAAVAHRFDDGVGGKVSSISPRVGAGLRMDAGRGSFALDLSGGEVFDGAQDLSASARFEMKF